MDAGGRATHPCSHIFGGGIYCVLPNWKIGCSESGKNCNLTQIPTDLSMTGFRLVPVAQRTKFDAKRSSAVGRL